MRVHRCFPLVLVVAAAACGSVMDVPTSPRFSHTGSTDDGDPPPPPVDTEFVATYDGTSQTVGARYFENKPSHIICIQFESRGEVVASPNARLMLNTKTGRTTGNGTLTFGENAVLDLRNVTLRRTEDGAVFGVCDEQRGNARCSIMPAPERETVPQGDDVE